MNKVHRDWRWKLGTYCPGGKNEDKNIFEVFENLSKDDWEAFKAHYGNEEFKVTIYINKAN